MADILLFIVGFALLALGGEWTVRVSMAIAGKMKLSTLLVSTVVIGFGTSVPELLVSAGAALKGSPGISIGNVVGSNICNTLLILGVAAAITPIACKSSRVRRSLLAGIAASALLAALSFWGEISRPAGLIMLAGLIAFLAHSIRLDREKSAQARRVDKDILEHIEEEMGGEKMSGGWMAFLAVSSLTFLLAGAHLLIAAAVSLAHHLGISESIIGLTLVALGTSLPELATAGIAAWRGKSDIVIGNVLGSNLFNIMGILGITSLIVPISFPEQIARQDVWVMMGSIILLVPIILPGKTISRMEGCALFILYFGYILRLYALSGAM